MLLTFPLIINFRGRLIGVQHDVYESIWLSWWFKFSRENNLNMWHSNFRLYPFGIEIIRYGSFLIPLLTSFVLNFSSPVFAYNFSVFIAVFLSAIFTYLLVRYLTDNNYAAFISGLIYAFSPYVYWEIWQGSLDLIHVEWIPLYCLFLFKLVKNKASLLNTICAFLILLIACFSNWYYGLFLILFTLLFAGYETMVLKNKLLLKNFLMKIVLVLFFVTISTAPFLIKINKQLHVSSDDRKVNWSLSRIQSILKDFREKQLEDISMEFKDSLFSNIKDCRDMLPLIISNDSISIADILKSFTPRGKERPHKSFFTPSTLILLIFSLLILESRVKRFYFSIAFFFFIFSLGPYLVIIHNSKIISYLPAILLYRFLPGFTILGCHPYRFSIIVILMSAVLIGELLTSLSKKYHLSYAQPYFIWLACLMTLEPVINPAIPYPLPSLDARIPFVYKILPESEKFAILETPVYQLIFLNRPHIYYQTFHHKPVWNGRDSFFDPTSKHLNFVLKNGFLRDLIIMFNYDSISYPVTRDRYEASIAQLKEYNFRYLIFHCKEIFYNPFASTYRISIPSAETSLQISLRMLLFLNRVLGPPVKFSDGLALYKIK